MIVVVVVVVDISEEVNNWIWKGRATLGREIGHLFFRGVHERCKRGKRTVLSAIQTETTCESISFLSSFLFLLLLLLLLLLTPQAELQ